jgi:hypothetical protein
MSVRPRRTRTAKRGAPIKSPRRPRVMDIPPVPTVRTEPDPVAAPGVSAEEEAALEDVRRMVEAAYT